MSNSISNLIHLNDSLLNLNRKINLLEQLNNKSHYDKDKLLEEITVDLSTINEEILNDDFFLNILLRSNLEIKNIKLIPSSKWESANIILACLSTKRIDLIKNLPPHLKNEDLLSIGLNKKIEYPILTLFSGQDFYFKPNLNTEEDKSKHSKITSKLVEQHPKNILEIPKEFINDNHIINYLIKFNNNKDFQTSHILSLRDLDWWIKDSRLIDFFLGASESSHNKKLSFDIFDKDNKTHELIALSLASTSYNLMVKYFEHFGDNEEKIENYISYSSQIRNTAFRQDNSYYTIFNASLDKQTNFMTYFYRSKKNNLLKSSVTDNNYNFYNFKNYFQPSIINVDKYLSSKNLTDNAFYSNSKENFYQLISFFINPHKYSEEDIELAFNNIDKCLKLFNDEKAGLLHIFSFTGNGQTISGGYPFTLTPYFANKWEINIKDLRKLTADDFYNMWISVNLSQDMNKDLKNLGQKSTQTLKKVHKF